MVNETENQFNDAKQTTFATDAPPEKDCAGTNDGKESKDIQYIVDHAFEAFWQVDTNFKITFTNAACGTVTGGFKSEDFIGRSLMDFLSPESIEKLYKGNSSRMNDEARGVQTALAFYELQMKRKDGTYCWVGISSSPIRDRSGKVIGYQGILRDISGFKKQETSRKRYEEAFNKAEKMSCLVNITNGVARELNRLMGGIIAHGEILSSCDGPGSNAFHDHVGNIIDSGERAVTFIQDLLAVSRKDEENRQIIYINERIQACLKKNEFQKLSQRYPDVTIKMDFEPSLRNVNASLSQLDKSILDLLSLSFKQTEPDGVISIATRTVYLGCPVRYEDNLCEGEYVVLSISSTGGGLEDEEVCHLFEPFYAKKFMKKSATGLELSIVREVIRDHNGFINAYSKIGCGLSFVLYLPVSREDCEGIPHRGNAVRPDLVN
ncbi:MAG TPA: PAS domain S-box protein [Smithellaceae bacterium]|jgi:PAS domain S-box-containing protein|nr:PAS domain S-box protein [Smithellaceae bacterium]